MTPCGGRIYSIRFFGKASVLYIRFALTPSHLSVLRCSHQRNPQRGRWRRQFHFLPCTSIDRNAGGAGECDQHRRAVAGAGRQRSRVSETAKRAAAFVDPIIIDQRRRRLGGRATAAQDAAIHEASEPAIFPSRRSNE